jgi:hypothetical protein
VLIPFGKNTRYDLVIDDGKRLARVQCKTGRLREGAVRFKTSSSYAHHANPRFTHRDYLQEVDFFAVYCAATSGAYLIPIDEIPLRHLAALRVQPARNNQRRRIRLASDYEIARVGIAASRPEPAASADAPGSSA